MSEDIPFDRSFDLVPGVAKEVAPGIRALCAGNASPFTFKGTVTYIVGRGDVAIIDPGPDDGKHIAALLDAIRGETVTHIFVTHTHRDHSPAVPHIVKATGAKTYGEGPHRASRPLNIGELNPLDASADTDFRPDVTLTDGAIVSGKGFTLEAITTPGHTANHMAYALKELNVLFSGDHVMGWSTSIVAPPDGAMSDYMNSLHKLTRPHGRDLLSRPRQSDQGRAAFRAQLHPPSRRPRGIDPAPAGQRRGRYPDAGARDLYRDRSAAHGRGRALGAGSP